MQNEIDNDTIEYLKLLLKINGIENNKKILLKEANLMKLHLLQKYNKNYNSFE
jgi:hypothetical protein